MGRLLNYWEALRKMSYEEERQHGFAYLKPPDDPHATCCPPPSHSEAAAPHAEGRAGEPRTGPGVVVGAPEEDEEHEVIFCFKYREARSYHLGGYYGKVVVGRQVSGPAGLANSPYIGILFGFMPGTPVTPEEFLRTLSGR